MTFSLSPERPFSASWSIETAQKNPSSPSESSSPNQERLCSSAPSPIRSHFDSLSLSEKNSDQKSKILVSLLFSSSHCPSPSFLEHACINESSSSSSWGKEKESVGESSTQPVRLCTSLPVSANIDWKSKGSWKELFWDFSFLEMQAARCAQMQQAGPSSSEEEKLPSGNLLPGLLSSAKDLSTEKNLNGNLPVFSLTSLFSYPYETRKLFFDLIEHDWPQPQLESLADFLGKHPLDQMNGLMKDAIKLKWGSSTSFDLLNLLEVLSSTTEEKRANCVSNLIHIQNAVGRFPHQIYYLNTLTTRLFKDLIPLSEKKQDECRELLLDVIKHMKQNLLFHWGENDLCDLLRQIAMIRSSPKICILYLKSIINGSHRFSNWTGKEIVELLRTIDFIETETYRPKLTAPWIPEQIGLITEARKACSEKLWKIYVSSPFYIKNGMEVPLANKRTVAKHLYAVLGGLEVVKDSSCDSSNGALVLARRLQYDGAHARLIVLGMQRNRVHWSAEKINECLVKTTHIEEFVLDEWVLPLFLSLDAAGVWQETSTLEFFELISRLDFRQLITRTNNIFRQLDDLVEFNDMKGFPLFKAVEALLNHSDIDVHVTEILRDC